MEKRHPNSPRVSLKRTSLQLISGFAEESGKHMSKAFNQSRNFAVLELIQRIQSDQSFPDHRRAGVLSSLRCFSRWLGMCDAVASGQPADEKVLSIRTVREMFRALTPSALGVSRKRLRNAESDLRFAVRFYELPSVRPPVASSEPLQKIESMISDRFAKMALGCFLRYLTSSHIDPWRVTAEDAEAFREALWNDRDVLWPRRTARRAIQAWNRERARNPQWPPISLSLRDTRSRWGLPWSTFPVEFQRAVDRFFCTAEGAEDIFRSGTAQLAPATIRAQKDLVRLAASALVLSGVKPLSIVGLRNVCTPTAFRAALQQIVTIKGGVTSTVENVAHVLRKLAKLSESLSPEETAEVEEAHKNLRRHFDRRSRPRMARDQEVLDRLDDERLVDALLSLPMKAVAAIRRSPRKPNKNVAIRVQLALALELLLCAPLRIKNLVALSLDEHFFGATLNGVNRTLLRIAGDHTKNGEPAEHILTEDTVRLLRLYIHVYRPLIKAEPGGWLFPGGKDRHKTENTLGTQLARWIRGELGIEFHPHLMRKIVPKLYLDQDPGGLEVVRRLLGHRSDDMLRKTYLQKVHRVSQQKYVEALEDRRLSAFGLKRICGNGEKRNAHG
jgi:integrase